MAKSTA